MPSEVARATVAPYAALLSRPVDDVADDLESFCNLLTKWNRTQNLVSRETADALWSRHVADSLQLLRWLVPTDRRFIDLGSGGGFPAIPIAIALKETGSGHLLVESNGKKASFLRTVIRELALDAEVDTFRAETIDSRETDIVTARAVAPLAALLGLAAPFLVGGARGLFHKGREYDHEVEAAAVRWRFDLVVRGSDTDPAGAILEITNLQVRQ